MAQLPQRGRVYTPQAMPEIRDDFLSDYRLAALDAGATNPAVQPGTDMYNKGTALGYMMLGAYANIEIHARSQNELEATGDELDAIREALGLPIVQPSPSSGKAVVGVTGGGSVTIPDALEFTEPNGLRGKVSGIHVGVVNNSEVSIVTINNGKATRLAGGQKIRFVSPPLNVSETARISTSVPLTGGEDAESDARKKERISNARKNRPSGGNWAHKIESGLNALASAQAGFAYPALGGPASERIVFTKSIDPDFLDFSRTLPDAAITIIRAAIQAENPSQVDIVVSSATDEPVDVTLQITVPDASSAGGDGTGWIDPTPWPPLEGGDSGRVTVSSVATTNQVTVTAVTATSPVAGQTHIAWWNPVDMQFETRLVTSKSGTAGAWIITVDSPLVASDGTTVAFGDFICPAAVSSEAYGKSWREIMNGIGPGENTSDSFRLPRAARHPTVSAAQKWPASLNLSQLSELKQRHAEITDGDFSYRSLTTATIPASVADPPNILQLQRFAIYPL